ncbi:MAG: hypothetical protein RLZZ584_2576, partial [Pseudomonadota bacterium]
GKNQDLSFHVIPLTDSPYYLIERAKQSGFDHKFLRLAREINESMPAYVVQLAFEGHIWNDK